MNRVANLSTRDNVLWLSDAGGVTPMPTIHKIVTFAGVWIAITNTRFLGTRLNIKHMRCTALEVFSIWQFATTIHAPSYFVATGLYGWNSHASQLDMFLYKMRLAIQSVTHLIVKTPLNVGGMEDMTTLLSQLATACPALQLLQVTGHVDRGLLVAFGAAYPSLSRLNLMNSLSHHTLQQLHLILPNLVHIQAKQSPNLSEIQVQAEPFCLSLLTCTRLLRFHAGECYLTPEMWYALLFGLKELFCALHHEPRTGLQVLDNLRHFTCQCQPFLNQADGPSIAALLRAAPGLESLRFKGKGKHSTHMVSCIVVSCVDFACTVYASSFLVHLCIRQKHASWWTTKHMHVRRSLWQWVMTNSAL